LFPFFAYPVLKPPRLLSPASTNFTVAVPPLASISIPSPSLILKMSVPIPDPLI
jgi:hypothetical protein